MGKKSKINEEEAIETPMEESDNLKNKMLRKKPWS